MSPPSETALPVTDSHDSPNCPAGKSSTGGRRNDARNPQCSPCVVILNVHLPEGQKMKPGNL